MLIFIVYYTLIFIFINLKILKKYRVQIYLKMMNEHEDKNKEVKEHK